jgi:hypothetical protein
MRAVAPILVLCAVPECLARPPSDVSPNPMVRSWFEGLHQPGSSALCCSISDCRVMPSRMQDRHHEVEIEGYRYAVPDSAIIRDIPNMMNGAVVCYTYRAFNPSPGDTPAEPQDAIEILCFVPPKPLS